MTAIAGHSMLSWAHVNLLGEYDFSDEKLPQFLRATTLPNRRLISTLAQALCRVLYLYAE